MDKQTLVDRQKKLEADFGTLRNKADEKYAQIENLRKEAEVIEDDLKRLQGRYAEVSEQLNLFDGQKAPVSAANVLEATPKEEPTNARRKG